MAEVRIEGLDAFKAQLDRLDFGKRQEVLEKSGLEIVEPLRRQASLNAPRDTGFLAENIFAVIEKKSTSIDSLTVLVGPGKKAFYGIFQEYGTAHHPAQEFLGPALEDTADEIQDNFGDVLQREIEKALA